ncbi:hypothetical protein HDU87_007169 [Geranomyces variabilis]|uniref:Uncharacterized protein n=1 Tax=Geranomyces variabilis TaxID=109894 RepID=A0AAD5XJW8_9FUNG|nr:hypothetical protein HDU87_007169 [Geranomyces variabilis]
MQDTPIKAHTRPPALPSSEGKTNSISDASEEECEQNVIPEGLNISIAELKAVDSENKDQNRWFHSKVKDGEDSDIGTQQQALVLDNLLCGGSKRDVQYKEVVLLAPASLARTASYYDQQQQHFARDGAAHRELVKALESRAEGPKREIKHFAEMTRLYEILIASSRAP